MSLQVVVILIKIYILIYSKYIGNFSYFEHSIKQISNTLINVLEIDVIDKII